MAVDNVSPDLLQARAETGGFHNQNARFIRIHRHQQDQTLNGCLQRTVNQ
jgi:hypothetical protein